jgi:ferritin-like metal-binding protein YciE
MAETTLQKLFLDELRDVYHAEKQLTKALPKLAKAATAPELREAFESHLAETETQVQRLEQVFELLGEAAKTKTCAGMAGIVEEGSDLIKESEKGAALDAGLIAGAQRAEHYEMAAYGSLMAWAKALGHDEVIELLEATLDEEKAADEKLSQLAEESINSEAAGMGEEDDEDDEEDMEEEEDEEEMAAGGRGASKPTGMGSRTKKN